MVAFTFYQPRIKNHLISQIVSALYIDFTYNCVLNLSFVKAKITYFSSILHVKIDHTTVLTEYFFLKPKLKSVFLIYLFLKYNRKNNHNMEFKTSD